MPDIVIHHGKITLDLLVGFEMIVTGEKIMSKKSKKKVTVRAVKQAMRALGISSSHPFAEEGALPYVYTASSAEIELCYIEYGDISLFSRS